MPEQKPVAQSGRDNCVASDAEQVVMTAQAGIQLVNLSGLPACAGVTNSGLFNASLSISPADKNSVG